MEPAVTLIISISDTLRIRQPQHRLYYWLQLKVSIHIIAVMARNYIMYTITILLSV